MQQYKNTQKYQINDYNKNISPAFKILMKEKYYQQHFKCISTCSADKWVL